MRTYDSQTLAYIDGVLRRYMPEKTFPEKIYEAAEYSLFGDGKRVRPFMMIAVSEMLSGDAAFIEPLFAGLEMIHTYSLIHDDLPCMDDDDLRRGRPTSHKVFGYATAVLAGDGLLNLAYETIMGGYRLQKDRERYMEAAGIIASCAGIRGMVGDQTADMMFDETGREPGALEYIYRAKTGALIRAAVMAGALSSPSTDAEQRSSLERYAYLAGMLFQLTDDILDMKDGLPEEGKMTYISVYGLEYVRQLCREYAGEAMEILSGFENSRVLREFTQMIYNRRK